MVSSVWLSSQIISPVMKSSWWKVTIHTSRGESKAKQYMWLWQKFRRLKWTDSCIFCLNGCLQGKEWLPLQHLHMKYSWHHCNRTCYQALSLHCQHQDLHHHCPMLCNDQYTYHLCWDRLSGWNLQHTLGYKHIFVPSKPYLACSKQCREGFLVAIADGVVKNRQFDRKSVSVEFN